MSPAVLDHVVSFALGITLKASIVLAVAALVEAVIRRRASAATRHMVWTLAIASVLLLPLALRGAAVVGCRHAYSPGGRRRGGAGRRARQSIRRTSVVIFAALRGSCARSGSRWHQPMDRGCGGICGRRARDAPAVCPRARTHLPALARRDGRARPRVDTPAERVCRQDGHSSCGTAASQPRAQHADGVRQPPSDDRHSRHRRHVGRRQAARRGPPRAGARRAVRLPDADAGVCGVRPVLVPSRSLVGGTAAARRARAGV